MDDNYHIINVDDNNSESSSPRIKQISKEIHITSFRNGLKKSQKSSDIYLLKNFTKIIEKNKNTSECIKEFSNGILISYGVDSKLYFYRYNSKDEIVIEKILSIGTNDNIINIEVLFTENLLLVCANKILKKIYLDPEYNYNSDRINICDTNSNYNNFCKIKDKAFFICKDKTILIDRDITNKMRHPREEKSKLNGIFYKAITTINENIIVFTSNRVISGGKDVITFYNNFEDKKVEFEGHSFIFTSTGLCLMEINNDQILFCACKKYRKGQRNGILLIRNVKSIFNENYDKKNNIKFINTKHFEIHCFCQISYLDDNNNKNLFNKFNVLFTKNYFFVGGYDTKKGKGFIKLCKINDEFEIEDIELFEGYKGAISSITQSSIKGHIYCSCWDGNNYYKKFVDLKEYLDKIYKIEHNNFDIENLINS